MWLFTPIHVLAADFGQHADISREELLKWAYPMRVYMNGVEVDWRKDFVK
jgi:hypothetical protein